MTSECTVLGVFDGIPRGIPRGSDGNDPARIFEVVTANKMSDLKARCVHMAFLAVNRTEVHVGL
eukprot:SAG11_NODE_737_length_7431_cov_7.438762_4_plen_64_part_00